MAKREGINCFATADRMMSDVTIKVELTWRWSIWIDFLALLSHSLQLSLRSSSDSPLDISWEASRDMLSSEGSGIS